VTLKGVDVMSRIVSNGKHATNAGTVTIAAMTIAGYHPDELIGQPCKHTKCTHTGIVTTPQILTVNCSLSRMAWSRSTA